MKDPKIKARASRVARLRYLLYTSNRLLRNFECNSNSSFSYKNKVKEKPCTFHKLI